MKILKILLVLFVFVIMFLLTYNNINNSSQCKTASRIILDVQNNLYQQTMIEYTLLDSNLIIHNSKNKLIRLKDLIGNSNKLVFRYTDINCNVCVENEIKKIRKVIDEIGKENILLFASYQSIQPLLIFKKINSIYVEIYNLNKSKLDFEPKNFETPYYFILGKDLIMKSIFIPNKNNSTFSENYLKAKKKDTLNK